MLTLSQINVYPIKSLGGISLSSSKVEKRGLKFDRRWMLINSNGDFMTQRQYPQMSLLQTFLSENFLEVKHKKGNLSSIKILFEIYDGEEIEVPIWNDKCLALTVNKDFDDWLSRALNEPCRMVYMPDTTERIVDKNYSPEKNIVSFADSFPFLIIGEASLKDLNSKLETPLPMNRFRPNFVFSGGLPFAEDTFNNFKIGDLNFQAVKPCARCVVTTVNQDTSEKGIEPLKTLASYRKQENKVMFGQNLICSDEGILKVGDEIQIIDFK
ncbi:MAG: MOSC N-terminal beta barrel domain-containing protein [Ignavibacteriaceae bacterium]